MRPLALKHQALEVPGFALRQGNGMRSGVERCQDAGMVARLFEVRVVPEQYERFIGPSSQ